MHLPAFQVSVQSSHKKARRNTKRVFAPDLTFVPFVLFCGSSSSSSEQLPFQINVDKVRGLIYAAATDNSPGAFHKVGVSFTDFFPRWRPANWTRIFTELLQPTRQSFKKKFVTNVSLIDGLFYHLKSVWIIAPSGRFAFALSTPPDKLAGRRHEYRTSSVTSAAALSIA